MDRQSVNNCAVERRDYRPDDEADELHKHGTSKVVVLSSMGDEFPLAEGEAALRVGQTSMIPANRCQNVDHLGWLSF